jgi:hypothetical protein
LPINGFDLDNVKEQLLCFNWKNLQPLHKDQNLAKSDKLLIAQVINHYRRVLNFLYTFSLSSEYQTVRETLLWLRNKLKYGKKLPDDCSKREAIQRLDKLLHEMGNPQPST